MSEIKQPHAGRGPYRKRNVLISVASGVAALALIAGSAVAVQANNAETARRCAEATTASQSFADTSAVSLDRATKARSAADGALGYAKADGAGALLSDVDKAKQDLAGTTVGTACTTREQAAAMVSDAHQATARATALDQATAKLSSNVTAFQEAEAKRIAAEKKAADHKAAAAAAAAKQKADEEGAAAATADAQAQAQADAAAPAAPAEGGYYQTPAPARQAAPAPAPAPYRPTPAPAPYQPAPAPAPAPAPVGGWTPPPAGSGGGHSCAQIGDHVVCG